MSLFFRNRDGELVESYKGAVLTTREKNYYDDSDFYATVFDAKSGLENIQYATTRYAGGGSATVDATAEVVEAANKYAYNFLRKKMFDKYVAGLENPVVGDRVRVKKGRKVKVGTEGTLFWVGEKRVFGGYSKWSQTESQKVGVALDDEKDESGRYKNVVWTYLDNLEVVNIGEKFKYSEVKQSLKWLKNQGWKAWVAYMAYPLEFVA